jgi:outer membrane protein assembly factor BamB
MELFGYVCSPFCSSKAEAQGIDIPVYAGKKSVVEARQWRKVVAAGSAIAAVVLGLVSFWFWYAWIGVAPRPVYSVLFTNAVKHGQSVICPDNQMIFLRGGTLARHDIKAKKEVWSCSLIDPKGIADAVEREMKEARETAKRARIEGWGDLAKTPSAKELTKYREESEIESLQLHVHGQNIWIIKDGQLVRYDWNTGKPAQKVALNTGYGQAFTRGDELVVMDASNPGQRIITHVNLENGESRVEKIEEPIKPELATTTKGKSTGDKLAGTRGDATAGLPLVPGAAGGRPMDPARVAEEAQRLSLPAKIALPAVLAGSMNQERALAAMEDDDMTSLLKEYNLEFESADGFSFVPAGSGYLEFGVRLLEEKLVTRDAMKAPPKKSALEGNVNASQSLEVANEILNEIQRSRGGGTVVEDESRYQVTVRIPESKQIPDWTGEVIGKPSLYPLKTVNVIAAGKSLTVLDRMNKKLWQASLTHEVKRRFSGYPGFGEQDEKCGLGPCVERADTVYVFDAAVLTAFELATGNVRWRLPSVGVKEIFFDDKGMLYVNTTTASPESIKYSRQIDVTQTTSAVVVKVDPKTGKTLWTSDPGLAISYLSGKYIYDVEGASADDTEENPYSIGLEPRSHIRIQRIDPKNGRVMGEFREKRAPLDVQFDENTIQVLFKKELMVLKCFSF